MNIGVLNDYIERYKGDFQIISKQEIYKWKAIKHFKDHFDLEAPDFFKNLENSFKKTNNLLDSQSYFPKRMLLANAQKTPENVRRLFQDLYDEEIDIKSRIEIFRQAFKQLNKKNFKGKLNDFQDHRSVNVYLTLQYPDRYFFYKFKMFNEFARKVEYPISIEKGKVENVTTYIQLCNIIREFLKKDISLINIYRSRLDNTCYSDKTYNLLTQDFIYSVARHFDRVPSVPGRPGKPSKPGKPDLPHEPQKPEVSVEYKEAIELEIEISIPSFSGNHKHDLQNEQANKALGSLGELWVLEYEKQMLNKKGLTKLAQKVVHSSLVFGDGLGYDILSYNETGVEKYIEVKTTRQGKYTTFYLTRNELEWSKRITDNYYLYRVYNFDDNPKLLIIKGDLTPLCEVPINYEVQLKKEKTK